MSGTKTEADLWLLNSCTVKNPAEDHFRNEIKLAQTLDKKVVVAGCVPQGERKSGYLQVGMLSFLGLLRHVSVSRAIGTVYICSCLAIPHLK